MMADAALDRRLARSGASAVFCPPKMDNAELPELPLLRAGRMIWEAPLRYDRCANSFVGDGGRSDGALATLGGGRRSGDAETGGGLRMDWRSFRSANESAWKNWLSGRDLLTDDDGGDGTSRSRLSSCLPSA
jgi:hypothetical protein